MVVGSRVPYLNTDEVHYDGQPVAVVVAERLEAAQYAASLVEVDYVELPAHVDFAAEQGRAKPVSQSLGMPTMSGRKGDAQAALASSPHRGGPAVHHPDPEPQRDGAARHDRGLGRRLASPSGTPPRTSTGSASTSRCGSTYRWRRCACWRRSSAAGSAARAFVWSGTLLTVHGRTGHRASRADGADPRRRLPDRRRPHADRPAGRPRRHRRRSPHRPRPRGGHAHLADGRQPGPGRRLRPATSTTRRPSRSEHVGRRARPRPQHRHAGAR